MRKILDYHRVLDIFLHAILKNDLNHQKRFLLKNKLIHWMPIEVS